MPFILLGLGLAAAVVLWLDSRSTAAAAPPAAPPAPTPEQVAPVVEAPTSDEEVTAASGVNPAFLQHTVPPETVPYDVTSPGANASTPPDVLSTTSKGTRAPERLSVEELPEGVTKAQPAPPLPGAPVPPGNPEAPVVDQVTRKVAK